MIQQYVKKDGTKAFFLQVYLGKDEVTGKQIRVVRRGLKSKKEAAILESRLKADFAENGYKKQNSSTFKEFYELWFESYRQTVKESTWCKTAELFRLHILPIFGDEKPDKIKLPQCQKAVNTWFKTLPSGYKKLKDYSSRVFEYAIYMEAIANNPMNKVTMPVKLKTADDEEATPNFYSKEELQAFLAAAKELNTPTAFTVFHLLAYTGMRKGEALALKWEDVNFSDSTISINKTLSRGENNRLLVLPPKSKKSARTISIDPQTMDLLKHWRTQQKIDFMKFGYNTLKPGQIVFPNNSNEWTQTTRPQRWLQQIYKNHPEMKQISTHGLRHTHCSLLFEAGATIKEVQERLGHGDAKITLNIYTHVTKQKKEETALKFANFMSK